MRLYSSLRTNLFLGLLTGLFLGSVGLHVYHGNVASMPPTEYQPVSTQIISNATTTTSVGPVLPASAPVRLRIPALAMEVPFTEPLGLDEQGEVAVPDVYDAVGWYQYSPTPGELGPAVVLGHVDSYSGPAVFFSLGRLQSGDDVYIDRADGTIAHFKVTVAERYEQVAFPTARVYGNIDHAGLRLITCTGTFERGKQRYSHNLVVYARLVE